LFNNSLPQDINPATFSFSILFYTKIARSLPGSKQYFYISAQETHLQFFESLIKYNMLSQEKILIVSNILKKIPDLACAYIHGSALTNYFRKKSDIDIALLFYPDKNTIDFAEDLLDYSSDIESCTGHTAHFSQLSSYNNVFSKEVVTRGELIICNDSYFCKTFTMHTFSMYANLNQERSKILEQYIA